MIPWDLQLGLLLKSYWNLIYNCFFEPWGTLNGVPWRYNTENWYRILKQTNKCFFLYLLLLFFSDTIEAEKTLPNNLTASHALAQRRESAPCETANVSFRIKRRSTKKILRRRSSGGPEILSPILPEGSNGSSAWSKFKRELSRKNEKDCLLTQRRGSLPVEVLVIGSSGKLM